MAIFRVEAIEQFQMRTTYRVEAGTAQEAESIARSGRVAYDDSSPVDDNGHWLRTLAVVKENKHGSGADG